MSQKLCWKCRETCGIKKIEESSALIYTYVHCHHDEPEEEPKCICQKTVIKDDLRWFVQGRSRSVTANCTFCPKCGRNLL